MECLYLCENLRLIAGTKRSFFLCYLLQQPTFWDKFNAISLNRIGERQARMTPGAMEALLFPSLRFGEGKVSRL